MEYYINKLQRSGKIETNPMPPSVDLRNAVPNSGNPSLLPLTGSLLYLVGRVRWDVAVAVGELSAHTSKGTSDEHMTTAKKTVNYLKSTASLGLRLGGLGVMELFGFYDAAYSSSGRCKSRLGGALFYGYNCGAFHCFSKFSVLIATSACHAEVFALFEMCLLMVHIRQIVNWVGICGEVGTIKLYGDNKACKELCESLKATPRTCALNPKKNWIRELINMRIISLHFVPSELNVADALTKALAVYLFSPHTDKLLHGFGGNCELFETTAAAFPAIGNNFDWSTIIDISEDDLEYLNFCSEDNDYDFEYIYI